MKPAPFAYICPETRDAALTALAEFGDDAVVLAGGLSLGAMLNMRLVYAKTVIDINRVADLGGIERMGRRCRPVPWFVRQMRWRLEPLQNLHRCCERVC